MTTSSVRVLLAAVALALVGCQTTIDMNLVKKGVGDMLAKAGAKVTQVTCPERTIAKKDDTFDCSVETDGGKFAVAVRQTDDRGTMNMSLKSLVMRSEKIEAHLVEVIKPTLVNNEVAKANCGARLRPALPKVEFDCLVNVTVGTLPGTDYTVKIKVEDDKGTYALSRPENWPSSADTAAAGDDDDVAADDIDDTGADASGK